MLGHATDCGIVNDKNSGNQAAQHVETRCQQGELVEIGASLLQRLAAFHDFLGVWRRELIRYFLAADGNDAIGLQRTQE